MDIKLQKQTSQNSKLSTNGYINFENLGLQVLKICPCNITSLQNTKNAKILRLNFSYLVSD